MNFDNWPQTDEATLTWSDVTGGLWVLRKNWIEASLNLTWPLTSNDLIFVLALSLALLSPKFELNQSKMKFDLIFDLGFVLGKFSWPSMVITCTCQKFKANPVINALMTLRWPWTCLVLHCDYNVLTLRLIQQKISDDLEVTLNLFGTSLWHMYLSLRPIK